MTSSGCNVVWWKQCWRNGMTKGTRRHREIRANHFYDVHGRTHRPQPIRLLFTLGTRRCKKNGIASESRQKLWTHHITIDTSDAAPDGTPRLCARVRLDVFCIIDNKILYLGSLNCVTEHFSVVCLRKCFRSPPLIPARRRWKHAMHEPWAAAEPSPPFRWNGIRHLRLGIQLAIAQNATAKFIPLTDDSSVAFAVRASNATCRKYKLKFSPILFFRLPVAIVCRQIHSSIREPTA